VEFDLDSSELAQKVQELGYEIKAGRIRVAFQAVKWALFSSRFFVLALRPTQAPVQWVPRQLLWVKSAGI
jgi:hypothetical protein